MDEIIVVTKQYINKKHSSIKLTPIQASLIRVEAYVLKSRLYKWKKVEPKFKLGDLVETTDQKKKFCKGDTTTWAKKLHTTAKDVNDTISNSCFLPKR